MKQEIPKCKDCGQPMIEVGETGKTIQEMNFDFELQGIRSQKIYQCPEDKTIIVF
jgi:hypothetical protein